MRIGCGGLGHIHAEMYAAGIFCKDLVEGSKLAAGKAHAWIGMCRRRKTERTPDLEINTGTAKTPG